MRDCEHTMKPGETRTITVTTFTVATCIFCERDNLRALLREAVDMATMQLNHLARNVETKANRLAAIAKEGKL